MEQKLSQEQLKTLKLFVYYCMGYGSYEVDYDLQLYNCSPDYWDKSAYGRDDRQQIPMYDRIMEVIEYIESNFIDYDKFEDCDVQQRLEFNFDCKERKLKVVGFYESFAENPSGTSFEGDNLTEDVISFMEELKSRGKTSYEVRFDGSGDSGYIGEGQNIPSGVEDFLYTKLGNYYGGWEINEGSYGEFIFFPDDMTVELNFNERLSQWEPTPTLFYCEF